MLSLCVCVRGGVCVGGWGGVTETRGAALIFHLCGFRAGEDSSGGGAACSCLSGGVERLICCLNRSVKEMS